MEVKLGDDPVIILVQWHISKNLFVLLRVKLKDLFMSFMRISFWGAFETGKLMDFLLKGVVHRW